MPTDGRRIAAAMSGGVDSAVAAGLLVSQGCSVIGVTMRLWHAPMVEDCENPCCSAESVDAARRAARVLGIDHIVLNVADVFRDIVVADFISEYAAGRTPNPCVVCNARIKFGELHRRLMMLGVDLVATGHYARRTADPISGRWLLSRAADRAKDQTYVLYRLTQDQLARSLFPLGGMTKPEVRAIARSMGLDVAERHDSQEICFVPPGMYRDFLAAQDSALTTPGPIMDPDGRVIGEHTGVAMYTVGQRKGLGALTTHRGPLYVLEIRPDENGIVVGPEELLYRRSFDACDVAFIPFDSLEDEIDVTAQVRYKSPAAPARISPLGRQSVHVEFSTAQRAVTPGQSVVFYSGDLVVGGGVIRGRASRSR